MDRSRAFFATYGLDAVIVLLAIAAALGIAGRTDPYRPGGIRFSAEVAAVVVMILILLLRRRAPFVVPATTWLWSAALSFVDGRLIVGQAPVSISGMIAAVLLGNLRQERQARVGAGHRRDLRSVHRLQRPGAYRGQPLLHSGALRRRMAGRVRPARAPRAQRGGRTPRGASRTRPRERRPRRRGRGTGQHRARAPRRRCARGQRHGPASGSGAPSDDRRPQEDREALRHVEQAGRTALAKMRRLLDALRREDDEPELAPRPGLGRIGQLVEDVRAAGLDVRLDVEGHPLDLSAGLDLSAYRLVQEGLTNALKHANVEHAWVEVVYGAHYLELAVRDDGRGATASDGLGHGLIGLGERVKIFGGEMTAGPVDGGGFALWARLPLKTG